MHGRPRQPYGIPEDPKKVEARQKKYLQLKQLTDMVLQKAQDKDFSPEALAQAALLLSKNPDVYSVWNYRREALAPVIQGEDRDKAKAAAALEVKVTENALVENPKSYSAWQHRLWVMQKGLLPLDQELAQVSRFLSFDSRNFHAWKYRREIVKLAGTDIEDELAYSKKLIDEDFGNYSAWHARSALLREKYSTEQVISLDDLLAGASAGSPQAQIPLEALDKEFELTQNCFFCDPNDQSAYFYHRWLLQSLMEHATNATSPSVEDVLTRLQKEEESCKDLIHEEPDSKWPKQSLAFILHQQTLLGKDIQQEDLQNLYQDLIKLDPYRAGFYRDTQTVQ